MRVAVFGAGGVGGYYGGRLARAGEDVVFIARGAHLQALRADGLTVLSTNGDFKLAQVAVTDDPDELEPVDAVIVAVKTWQLVEAARQMKPLVGASSILLPLLNGVEAGDQLAAVLGSNHVLKGVTRIISFIESPGVIRHLGAEPYIALGEADNRRSDRCERLRDAFDRAGVRASIPPDIDVALWEKFLLVVPLGGVSAVTRSPIGVLRAVPESRGMLEAAMQEVFDVGRARGVKLRDGIVADSMTFVDGLPAEGTPSLQRDVIEGRRSELEAWNGAVVRLGREVGVPTPVHGFIYASLLPQERRARGGDDSQTRSQETQP